jgi:hypothetical protein
MSPTLSFAPFRVGVVVGEGEAPTQGTKKASLPALLIVVKANGVAMDWDWLSCSASWDGLDSSSRQFATAAEATVRSGRDCSGGRPTAVCGSLADARPCTVAFSFVFDKNCLNFN